MALLKDTRGFRPFRSSEEYLYAMKEDLAEWLNMLYPHLHVTVDTFIHRLETGVVLCEHANAVYAKAQAAADSGLLASLHPRHAWKARVYHGGPIRYFPVAKAGTFFARDNVSNFITWCRNDLQVLECLLFETEDLILMKNEKNVILCLLEVARRGARLGMLAPMLIQLEQEIDREIARDQRAAAAARGLQDGYEDDVDDDDDLGDLENEQALKEYGPMPQIVTNDLKSLDEMVRDLVARCSCPVQFPMIRVSEGKYRIGDTKVLIFVRVLRSHVMVRVGGGWDTLSHYLDKHDPCRCKTSHRSPLSAKLILKNTGAIELDTAKVMYERSPPRTRRSSASSVGSNSGINMNSPSATNPTSTLIPASNNNANTNSGTRSRSTTPRRANNNNQTSPALNVTDSRTRSKSPAKGGGFERRSMRTRSKSPAVNQNNSPNPSSNIHRSRSPNRKALESPQQTQQTPVISIQTMANNTKVYEDRSSPILDQNTTSEENKEPSTDSGSEISDEGYRSLPTNLQSTPNHQLVAVQPTVTAPNDDETISMNQIEDDEDETIRITTTEEGTLVQIFPKTIEQTVQQEEVVVVEPPEMQEPPKEVHRFASLGVSPRRIPLSPSPSNVSIQNASPKKGSLAPSNRSMSIEAMDGCVSKKSNSRTNNYGTWTSRTYKQRPNLTPDSFARNTPQRRSLGASPIKKQTSLPSSLQTSPTKQISAILDEQLKQTDDRSTLLEIKQMIQQYQHLVEERLEQVNQESGTSSSGPSSLPPLVSSSLSWTPRTSSTGNNKPRSRIPAPTMASIRRPSSAID